LQPHQRFLITIQHTKLNLSGEKRVDKAQTNENLTGKNKINLGGWENTKHKAQNTLTKNQVEIKLKK